MSLRRAAVAASRARERVDVAVRVADELRARQQRAVVEARVVEPVARRRVAAAGERGQDREVREVAGRERQRARVRRTARRTRRARPRAPRAAPCGRRRDATRRRPRPSARRLRARRRRRRDRSRARGSRCSRTRAARARRRRRVRPCGDVERAARARESVGAALRAARPRARRCARASRGAERHAAAWARSAAQPQLGEQRAIGVDVGIAGREQAVAVEDRVRAGEEAQRLHRVAELAAARGQPHHRLRHRDARDRDRAHELERIERGFAVQRVVQRRAFDLHQVVDRHRLRIRIEVRELRDQRPRAARASRPCRRCRRSRRGCRRRARGRACRAGRRSRASRRSRRRTRARCRGCGCSSRGRRRAAPRPGRPSACRASRRSRARAPSPRAPCRAPGSRSRSFGPRHAAPMQKRVAPAAFAARAASTTVVDVEHRLVGDAGVIARGLRAVAAVLGAAAGLDRDQRRQLDGVGRVMRAVHLLRAEQEVLNGSAKSAATAATDQREARAARRPRDADAA